MFKNMKFWHILLISLVIISTIGFFVTSDNFFNRDPARFPDGEGMLSPADGVVTSISNNTVYIYIGLQDVHIQRSPLDGKVLNVMKHREDNKDKVEITIETEDGLIKVTQISGYVAKTIETDVEIGDELYRGRKIGHILLGSATEVTVPLNYDIKVNVGNFVKAGKTVIAVK